MAGRPPTKNPKPLSRFSIKTITKNPKPWFACALLLLDAVLVALIITYVSYTKIDWDAYMSQVTGFLEGEMDYANLKGDTGPLVYLAGYLYVYSAIQFVTGGEVHPAQILFGVLYIINLAIVFYVYVKTDTLPWWALSLLCLSKRVHSIFVLRLFNDCVAMTLLHASLALLLNQRWHLGLVIFSGAVSIKMNVLLYAPSLLLLMLKAMDIGGVISALAGAALAQVTHFILYDPKMQALVLYIICTSFIEIGINWQCAFLSPLWITPLQIILGLPFIISHPFSYISRAFNLGRVFVHFWSVNFKFVPEHIFVSKTFAISLLICHLGLLVFFAHYKWCRHDGGLFSFLRLKIELIRMRLAFTSSFALNNRHSLTSNSLDKKYIVTTMFVGNFIGIICARSLHYQFYSWYFHSLPYLLWSTTFPTVLRLILFAVIELCWNVYPSNTYSSTLLLGAHLIILWGLWTAPPEYPYAADNTSEKKK